MPLGLIWKFRNLQLIYKSFTSEVVLGVSWKLYRMAFKMVLDHFENILKIDKELKDVICIFKKIRGHNSSPLE